MRRHKLQIFSYLLTGPILYKSSCGVQKMGGSRIRLESRRKSHMNRIKKERFFSRYDTKFQRIRIEIKVTKCIFDSFFHFNNVSSSHPKKLDFSISFLQGNLLISRPKNELKHIEYSRKSYSIFIGVLYFIQRSSMATSPLPCYRI